MLGSVGAGVGAPVADRETREETLRSGEEAIPAELRAAALEGLPLGVLLIDAQGILKYENAAARRMLGVPPGMDSPAVGSLIAKLPSMRDPAIQAILARIAAGESVQGVVVEFTSIFGHTLTLVVDAGPAPGSGSWIAFRDLAHGGPLAGRLLAAQRLEFVGVAVTGVIHDLNNLITALGGTLEVMRRGRAVDAGLLSNVDGLLRRSRDVTRRLLQAARPGEEHYEPLDLRTPLRQAADLLRNSLGAGIAIHCSLPESQVPVLADRTMLLQCVFNLGVNARDAMHGRGEIFLALDVINDPATCRRRNWPGYRFARIRVADTGPGIPSDTRERVFEPFFSTKDPDKSTGMGLSVVKRAVIDHKGTLQLVDLPGLGACFEIGLPFFAGPVEDDEPTRAMSLPPGVLQRPEDRPLDGMRILVADDEPSVRVLLERALTDQGAEVEPVANGTHAIQALREARGGRPFQAAILDVRLPGLGGYEAIGLIRSFDPDIRLLAISGLEPEGPDLLTLKEMRAAFLPKPFRLGDVVDALLSL